MTHRKTHKKTTDRIVKTNRSPPLAHLAEDIKTWLEEGATPSAIAKRLGISAALLQRTVADCPELKRILQKRNKGRKKPGPPSRYPGDVQPRLEDITRWAAWGMTRQEIARRLGLNRTTLRKYAEQNEDLAQALSEGDEAAVDVVEAALMRKAVNGGADGLGDTRAQMFYLKNKRPGLWREKKDSTNKESIDLSQKLEEARNRVRNRHDR